MKKAIFSLLVFISLILLLIRFGSEPLAKALGLQERSGLRVEATNEARVFINNQEVGKTPFQGEDFSPGDHLVKLEDSNFSWQGYVKLNSGTLSVINRELAATQASSSGEIITLEKGKGVAIISTPESADVEIDSKQYGKTPLLVSDITSGEHLFIISHPNFLKRSVRVVLTEGYKLTLNVDLAISEADFTKIVTQPIQTTQEIVIKQTPTNFLRVRLKPSVGSSEVARVKPKDTLILLEEIPSWYRVRLPDGKEGYISSSYAEKKNPQAPR